MTYEVKVIKPEDPEAAETIEVLDRPKLRFRAVNNHGVIEEIEPTKPEGEDV